MNGRSDASTSTDDFLNGRPLCLFYFTHPFGVLSPEPPVCSVMTPPAHLARAYFNMSGAPVPAHWSPSSHDYCTESSSRTTPILPMYPDPLDQFLRRDSVSSLFSSDVWLNAPNPATISRSHKLPPLQLTAPRVNSPPCAPILPPAPHRFSLPPLELPLNLECEEIRARYARSIARKRPRLSSVQRMMTGLMRRKVKGTQIEFFLSNTILKCPYSTN
ncbi:unnamed protein product [Leptosia nina]|uniref:Uncharacterized protein n=1 Tax=Leptosia nina TaxID=320188 RepID=A0AAV1JBN8_9NEOP